MGTAAKIILLALGLLVVLLITRFYFFGFVHAGAYGPPLPVLLAEISGRAIKVYLVEIAIFIGLGAYLLRRGRSP